LNSSVAFARLHPPMERKIFFFILIAYILGFSLHAAYLKKTIYGDGVYYYSWMHSVLIDGDVHFGNEYSHLEGAQPITPLAIPGNKYSVGPAILWSPWFLWTHTIIRGTGYEFPYQYIVGLSSVFYAYVGLLLLYILLAKYFNKLVSLASVAAIAGATNLLFYGSVDTVNSHAVSFFVSVLFLSFLFQKQKNWFAIGCALGIAACVRTQDIVLGLLTLPYLSKKHIHLFLLGILLFFLPQLIAWQLVYGTFWINPYLAGPEGFNFLKPQILGVLFSPQNGLALWTPVVMWGSVGLWMKNANVPLKLMAVTAALAIYVVACWSTWWQGASYSGRMFVSILPLIAFRFA
jgi:hypothetical protein